MQVKYRAMLWLDEQGNCEQVALAKYLDDEKLTEQTWTPEPFDLLSEIANQIYKRLTFQGTLW